MKSVQIGSFVDCNFNGVKTRAKVVGMTADGKTALVNGSPLFGEVPLLAEGADAHPLDHVGDTGAAYYRADAEQAAIPLPGSTSSEPAVKAPTTGASS